MKAPMVRPLIRRHVVSAALALAAAAAAGPALAHAFLETASPKAGAQLAAPPKDVRITFSEAVEPAFSKITVEGPPGFGGADPARPAGDPRTLEAALRGATPPGGYVVRWRVVSHDSHVTQGTFRFELKP
jgi:methionine-rich copper-binding protein CopC